MTDHLEKSNSKVDDFIVYSWFEMGFAVMRVPFFILITYSHTGMFSPTLRFAFRQTSHFYTQGTLLYHKYTSELLLMRVCVVYPMQLMLRKSVHNFMLHLHNAS